MGDRTGTVSDGIPREVVDEITDRLASAYGNDTPSDSVPDGLAATLDEVLLSFERDLMKLNRRLRRETDDILHQIRDEYAETSEAISELNAELDSVVKGNIG